MSQKTYFFSVWPPVGDDCPGAMAAVVSTSPKSALKALREARLKVTSKHPIFIESDSASSRITRSARSFRTRMVTRVKTNGSRSTLEPTHGFAADRELVEPPVTVQLRESPRTRWR